MSLLADQIKSAALNLGYEKCGIIKISDIDGYKEKLDERVERVPAAKGFYQGQYRFTHLQDTYPWAKSIVICVRKYGKYHIPEHLKGMIAKYYLVDGRKDENSKDFQDSLKFEKYMKDLGLRAETERGFGLVPLRFAAMKACPMNKNRWQETEEFPNLQKLSEQISLEKIIKMDYKFLEEVMQPKFWYIDKASVWKWKVNAINAMVNDYKEQYREHILYACNDSNSKVREMAEWAIKKLNLQ